VGGGLQAHGDGVIAGGEPVGVSGHVLVDHDHRPGGIFAPGDEPDLQPLFLERIGKREPAAGSDGTRRSLDHLIGDQVERAEPVVVAPSPPVVHLCGDLGDWR